MLESFYNERDKIVQACIGAEIDSGNIHYSEMIVPPELPAVIVTMHDEKDHDLASNGYQDNVYHFNIFVIVNAQDVADPDTVVVTLFETIRAQYKNNKFHDFHDIEVYFSRTRSAQEVRILKAVSYPGK